MIYFDQDIGNKLIKLLYRHRSSIRAQNFNSIRCLKVGKSHVSRFHYAHTSEANIKRVKTELKKSGFSHKRRTIFISHRLNATKI